MVIVAASIVIVVLRRKKRYKLKKLTDYSQIMFSPGTLIHTSMIFRFLVTVIPVTPEEQLKIDQMRPDILRVTLFGFCSFTYKDIRRPI